MVDFKDELWMNVWYTLSNQAQLFVLYSRSNQKLLKSFSSRRFLSKQLGYFLTDSVLMNTRDSSCNPARLSSTRDVVLHVYKFVPAVPVDPE